MQARASGWVTGFAGLLLSLLLSYSAYSQPCSGVPVAGSIAGADTVCPFRPLTLSLTGYATASGITFQWSASAPGGAAFTPIPGATTAALSVPVLTASTDYRVTVTCSNTGDTASTAVHPVYVKEFYECYCDTAGLGGSTLLINIDSVSIAGTTLNNYTPGSTAIYSIFPPVGSTTAHLQAGGLYTIVMNTGYHPSYTPTSVVWIDYNRNGIYVAGEAMMFGPSSYGVSSILMPVPVTAQQGLTGMRVRSVVDTLDDLTCAKPCDSFITGETQDYVITIDSASPCNTLSPGIIVGPDSVCTGRVYTLAIMGYGGIADITYQWKWRNAGGGAFTAISGATDSRYMDFGPSTSKEFEVVVTCPATGATATSPVYTLRPRAFYNCYCSPEVSTVLVNDLRGRNMVTAVGVAGTTLNASGMRVSNSGSYVRVPLSPLSNTATLLIGSSYAMSVRIDSATYHPHYVGVWIDANRNGSFDSSEFSLLTALPTGGTFTGSVAIPPGTAAGLTGMRVAVSDSAIPTTPPCTRMASGEVIDFTVTIATPNATIALHNEEPTVTVMPNPAKTNLAVGLGKEGVYTLKLLDVLGRVMVSNTTTGSRAELDLSGVAAGMYLLRCEGEGFVRTVRICKE